MILRMCRPLFLAASKHRKLCSGLCLHCVDLSMPSGPGWALHALSAVDIHGSWFTCAVWVSFFFSISMNLFMSVLDFHSGSVAQLTLQWSFFIKSATWHLHGTCLVYSFMCSAYPIKKATLLVFHSFDVLSSDAVTFSINFHFQISSVLNTDVFTAAQSPACTGVRLHRVGCFDVFVS